MNEKQNTSHQTNTTNRELHRTANHSKPLQITTNQNSKHKLQITTNHKPPQITNHNTSQRITKKPQITAIHCKQQTSTNNKLQHITANHNLIFFVFCSFFIVLLFLSFLFSQFLFYSSFVLFSFGKWFFQFNHPIIIQFIQFILITPILIDPYYFSFFLFLFIRSKFN